MESNRCSVLGDRGFFSEPLAQAPHSPAATYWLRRWSISNFCRSHTNTTSFTLYPITYCYILHLSTHTDIHPNISGYIQTHYNLLPAPFLYFFFLNSEEIYCVTPTRSAIIAVDKILINFLIIPIQEAAVGWSKQSELRFFGRTCFPMPFVFSFTPTLDQSQSWCPSRADLRFWVFTGNTQFEILESRKLVFAD